ncbi:hypothetical protein ACFQU9_35800 [Actinomadura namibiensis]|uniref:Uncharacterized protein n=1 Tax=Actinomadura namibiensis TaxID=182080 RepID=A0A7W3QQV4_ACTNM|nr:hypothetical protein [Actinomadura namibiensis]MBA8955708.1 hypothetical protein [Actinomadura namibiensis]
MENRTGMPGTPRGPEEPGVTGPQPYAPHAEPPAPAAGPAQPPPYPSEATGGPIPGPPSGGAARPDTVLDGPAGMTGRETSGVQVRISSRRARNRAAREEPARNGRRNGIVAAAAIATAAVLVTGGLLLMPGSDESGGPAPRAGGEATSSPARAKLPRAGRPLEVGTADGSRYRIAAVGVGTAAGAAPQSGSQAQAGGRRAYVEYVLSNPSRQKALLDFPGDVFVRRALLPSASRARCVWQTGVPEDMCTPPIKSEVVRPLAGGPLLAGDGDDRYLPPGGAYLVRATVDVPVLKGLKARDLRLYVWKKLYVEDQVARRAPFPS